MHSLRTDPRFAQVVGLGRQSAPPLNLVDEDSVRHCAQAVHDNDLPLRLLIDATGYLHSETHRPEKSWQQLDPAHMAHHFAINAIGPALLMKHFLPLLAREGKSVFATLSAKVGSIGDNQLGGWYSYRASKAALNQLVRTAAIELRRKHPDALCVALHPGMVSTALSAPFAKTGLDVKSPEEAALRLMRVIGGLHTTQSGGFFHHDGTALPW